MKSYVTASVFIRTIVLLLAVISGACNPTRYLTQDQALVKKVAIKGINKEFSEPAANYVQQGIRRNSPLYLALYNTFNTKKGKYKTEKIKNIGEAPHILDSLLVEVSRTQIEKFLKSKGYFKATVKSDIRVSKKKAYISFTADQGPEFKINEISYDIPDTAVRNLYFENKPYFTHITPGMRYDSDSLTFEREKIFVMMKGSGYYDYFRQYVRFDVDTNQYASKANLKMYLSNPKTLEAHQVYTINESFITIKNSDGRTTGAKPDTTTLDSGLRFIDYSGRFKPKKLSRYMYIQKNETYNINHENLTYDRLYDLNVFKNLKIDYAKTSDSSNRLNPIYTILPLKKMSNRIEGEYTFNSGRNGFNIGNTFTNRNVFGGAEQLEIKARYGILFDSGIEGNLLDRILSRDLQLGVNLIFPKLLTPFGVIQSGLNGIPHTTISSSFQIYDQRNSFSNRIFVNSITYDWSETKYKQHTFTPINLEFRNGKLDAAFRARLDSSGYSIYVLTNDRQYFNSSSQYSFTFNNIRLNTFANFLYLRLNADLGGNTLGLVKKLIGGNNQSTIFGLSFLQYTKTEVDARFYRDFGGEKQLIVRLNPGVEFPYGNSKVNALPFERLFYAGGSSGVRAWQVRTLGPGNYNRKDLKSDTLRANLRNLDQLGEIKIEGNLEYRFKVIQNFYGAKVKGAVFTDFGNVWRLRENEERLGEEFKFNRFLNQLAIGTGAGLRFDLNFFIFRLDAGIKVKDPQFIGSNQWVIKNLFNSKDFKEEYSKTNGPDRYRFVQYNFGIGMPF